jgi:P4 family phage/plasmid primase-like protien
MKRWQNLILTAPELPLHFGNGPTNIGVLTGSPSGNIVDSDVDCALARRAAETFLPPTDLKSGRASAPDSHYWYRTQIRTKKFIDPDCEDDEQAMLVEIRSTGCQTLVSPSTHPSGEIYEWSSKADPSTVAPKVLLECVQRLAACALLARRWRTGRRHGLTLALSGVLLRRGWTSDRVEQIIFTAARAAGDEDLEDRHDAIRTTIARISAGQTATGLPTLADLLPEKSLQKIVEWLDLKKDIPKACLPAENVPQGTPQAGNNPPTPLHWFAERFPALPPMYGDACEEVTNAKTGVVSVEGLNEDFLAATLGEDGNPEEPTVYLPNEGKHYSYSKESGIFVAARPERLIARISELLLEAARGCHDANTRALEFRFRGAVKLVGAITKSKGLLAAPSDYFEAGSHVEYLPVANGMLHIRDRELLPYSPAYRRRNKLTPAYEAGAGCEELFLNTLLRPQLPEDDINLLQRWCGLALTGVNVSQVILLVPGEAGSGKGVLVRVVKGLVGIEHSGELRTQQLLGRFEVGRLAGKSLLYGPDVPEDFLNHGGAGVLKKLSGGDLVTFEHKGSNETASHEACFNIVVTSNSRLNVHLEGDEEAWRRRLRIIRFPNPRPDHVIVHLDKLILQRESSGVLNWALEGLDQLRADGWQLNQTSEQQKRVDDLLLESDSISIFAKECLSQVADAETILKDTWPVYVRFCNSKEWRIMPEKKFSPAITDAVARIHVVTISHSIPDASGKNQRGWRGISMS